MNRPLAIGGLAAVVVAGVAWAVIARPDTPPALSSATIANVALPPSATAPAVAADEVRVDGQDEPVDAGSTPMAQRVAVLGLLNKRNGVSRDVTMRPGQAVRVGDVILRLRACERTAPWEPDPLTGAFVQVDVRRTDTGWRRAFSGWLYKERPALNVVIHPVYDVWAKSCTMTFPGTAPAAPAPSTSATASSAKKSPAPSATADPSDDGAADAPVEESAAPSNAT